MADFAHAIQCYACIDLDVINARCNDPFGSFDLKEECEVDVLTCVVNEKLLQTHPSQTIY